MLSVDRTKEQLGYVVYVHMKRASGVQGLQVVIQGDKHPDYVDCRIEKFLGSVKVKHSCYKKTLQF